jgi:hypothetical protein
MADRSALNSRALPDRQRSCAGMPEPLVGGAPMIRNLLIVQMPIAGHERGMAFRFSPRDCFVLRFEPGKHAIGMILDNVLCDWIMISS